MANISKETRKIIMNGLQEISNSMLRIKAEKDLIKEIVETVSEESDLSKKVINRMARVYHKNNFTSEVSEMEEFQDLF